MAKMNIIIIIVALSIQAVMAGAFADHGKQISVLSTELSSHGPQAVLQQTNGFAEHIKDSKTAPQEILLSVKDGLSNNAHRARHPRYFTKPLVTRKSPRARQSQGTGARSSTSSPGYRNLGQGPPLEGVFAIWQSARMGGYGVEYVNGGVRALVALADAAEAECNPLKDCRGLMSDGGRRLGGGSTVVVVMAVVWGWVVGLDVVFG